MTSKEFRRQLSDQLSVIAQRIGREALEAMLSVPTKNVRTGNRSVKRSITKTDAAAAVRGKIRKGVSLAETVSEGIRAVELIEQFNAAPYWGRRWDDRATRPTNPRMFPQRVIFEGTAQQRLAKRRVKLVADSLSALRRATNGHQTIVGVTQDPAKVGMRVEEGRCRPYGGAYKSWTAATTIFRVTVPQDWICRVYHHDLELVDGMATLDASPVEAPEGMTAFAATWVEQGRGFQVHVRRGFIARAGRFSFHANTLDAAIAGVRRKAKLADLGASSPRHATVLERAAHYPDAPVSLADALATGACLYGIRSWCYGVGINPEGDTVPLSRVVEGYRQRPQEEAIRVIAAVCRREARAREGEHQAKVLGT